jgi:hypothetical protein
VDELIFYLRRFRRRLRLFDGWKIIQRGMWLAVLVSLMIQVTGRIFPIERLGVWSLLPPCIWLVTAGCYSALRPISLLHTARRVDLELVLFERLSTSLSMIGRIQSFPKSLVRLQAQDALDWAKKIDTRQEFPLRIYNRQWLYTGIISAGMILMALWPNPMDLVLEQKAALAQATKEQAQAVERLHDEVEKTGDLSPEQKQEILRQLADLAEKLRNNPGNLDQALADFSQVEKGLEARIDPNTQVQAANLKSLVDQLQALANETAQSNQDLVEAAEAALNAISDNQNQMVASERQSLSTAMAQMAAQAAQAGDLQLAQAFAQMAQALQSNQGEALQSATQQAASAFSQAQNTLQSQARLGQVLSQLQASRQALAQSGQSIAQSSSSTGGQGAPTGGGGTNAPILPPGTGQGMARPPQGSKPVGGEDDLNGQASNPRETGGSNGDELFIPGLITGQGETQVRQGDNPLPGSPNPALVPYFAAYYDYLNAAMQALGQSYIPTSLSDYVQQYFLQLEPK